MKVKITHPTEKYQAGTIQELPDPEAKALIAEDWAFEIREEVTETIPDEAPKKRKVKHDNG